VSERYELSDFTGLPAEISRLVVLEIPQDHLPLAYLNSLSADDATICLRAIMICWVMSRKAMVPREMQLRVVLADVHAKDALVAAGTGSGKTLPIALCILLDDPEANYLSITISPLKRLVMSRGNPRVTPGYSQLYPYPYPSKPLPLARGQGFWRV
jgi:hypothetical protein